VLSVSGTRCTRRCRACMHNGTVYLPKIRKKVIYIDQFVFSNFVKVLDPEIRGHERAASDPFWKQLFEILDVVRHIQLVACPDSREHQHESLTSSFYESLKHTYEHFSGGVSFDDSETIKLRQIADMAKCWLKKEPITFEFNAEGISSGRIHEWSDRVFVTVDGDYPGRAEELRRIRRDIHERLKRIFAQWQSDRKTFKEVFAAEKSAYRENLVTGYIRQSLKRKQMPLQVMRGQMPSLEESLPTPVENQMWSLQHLFRLNVVEKQQRIHLEAIAQPSVRRS
jgi:hypothetical protein